MDGAMVKVSLFTAVDISSPNVRSVVPDGYGLSYSIGDEYIRWTVTCLKEIGKKGKGAKDMKKVLQEAADEVKALLDSSTKDSPKARL
jgi:carnitine O-acetyltransferase